MLLYSHNMENIIAKLEKRIANLKGSQFASLTYLSKKYNELSRYTVILGFSYHKLVEKSVVELEILIADNKDKWTALEKQAADEVMSSFQKTLESHSRGEQNDDYTKKDQYIPVANGININTVDNTVQLFGMIQSKVVLQEGVYPVVNSKPLTIAKNNIRKQLSISKFREFAIDLSQMELARVNGETLEFPESSSK